MRGSNTGFSRLPEEDGARRPGWRGPGRGQLVLLLLAACATLLLARALYGVASGRGVGQPGAGGRRRYPADCALTLSIWSRGLMRSCCDVYPEAIAWLDGGAPSVPRGEHGTTDWDTVPIRNGSIVYVPSLDVPRFLRRFAALPPSARLTLVSGQEDVGMPRELWGLGRRRALSARMPVSLESFLNDGRLLHWWVQNYDLLGCNPYSGCSHLPAGSPLAAKVSPIPIGLDLHTAAEKLRPPRAESACAQQRELDATRARLPAFRARPARLLAPFKCREDRRDACTALRPPAGVATFFAGPRAKMWRAAGGYAFVAAPAGHGVDTHRLWEALALGSVPVALASSLDSLYAEFPVVTLGAWDEANASALAAWRAQIERRFGAEPFTAEVRRLLTSDTWAARIAARHDAALAGGAPLAEQPLLPAAARRPG